MWLLILIVLAAGVVMVFAFIRPAVAGSSTWGLRRRFGPEYDRTVNQHGGDRKAAEKELAERVKRHGSLKERPLSPEDRMRYDAEWARVQAQFVDSPGQAVAEADQLIARLARDRGYPDGEQGERISALSVHHPRHIGGYRKLHQVAERTPDGSVQTEELREVLVHARELFTDLAGKPARAAPARHAQSGGRGRSRDLGHRLTERLHPPRALRRGGGARGSAS